MALLGNIAQLAEFCFLSPSGSPLIEVKSRVNYLLTELSA